ERVVAAKRIEGVERAPAAARAASALAARFDDLDLDRLGALEPRLGADARGPDVENALARGGHDPSRADAAQALHAQARDAHLLTRAHRGAADLEAIGHDELGA